MTGTRAYFDSVRSALVFAFNHEDLSIPGPVMNREMAQIKPDRPEGGILKVGKGEAPPARKTIDMGGLEDRTVLAGWIMKRVLMLHPEQQWILAGECVKPRRLCSCGRACCRGWSIKKEWVGAVRSLVEYLKSQAEVAKQPGTRGYSTDPRLRVALVEDFLRPEKKRKSINDLAELSETTAVTVAKHRNLIFETLQSLSDVAWDEISRDLDQVGLVGVVSSGD